MTDRSTARASCRLATLPELWRSAFQHFAAGVVFAAISTEIMPSVMHAGTPGAALTGFSIGVAAMFAMRFLAARLERGADESARPAFPVGVLIAGALALEMFFLGLTAADTTQDSGARRLTVVASCIGLATVPAVSTLIGFNVMNGGAPATLTLLLAFGSAALLYLVTEELLVRAHEHGEMS